MSMPYSVSLSNRTRVNSTADASTNANASVNVTTRLHCKTLNQAVNLHVTSHASELSPGVREPGQTLL